MASCRYILHYRGKIFSIREWYKMRPYFSYFALFLVIPLRAEQSQLEGSRGLKQGVHMQGNLASYSNFAVDKFHRLQGSVSLSSVVSNYRECALSCVNTPPCFSFNVAATPVREDGKYQCELLNEDKYAANPGQLTISQEYHHYSIKVLTKDHLVSPLELNLKIPTPFERLLERYALPQIRRKFFHTFDHAI